MCFQLLVDWVVCPFREGSPVAFLRDRLHHAGADEIDARMQEQPRHIGLGELLGARVDDLDECGCGCGSRR